MDKQDCKYWPFFCEENIWHLCQAEKFREMPQKVIFISNADKACAISNQQSGNGKTVIWDYHVVLLVQDNIWDLDTLLPFPCDISFYLEQSFQEDTDKIYLPEFRLIDSKDYIKSFASDRRHMLDANGIPLHPKPPWPAIHPERGSNLYDFIDMRRMGMGDVLNLQQVGRLK